MNTLQSLKSWPSVKACCPANCEETCSTIQTQTYFHLSIPVALYALWTSLLSLTFGTDGPRTCSPFPHRKGQKPNKNCQSEWAAGETRMEYVTQDGLWGGGKAQSAEEIAGTHQCLADSLQSLSLGQKSPRFTFQGGKLGLSANRLSSEQITYT